MNTVRADWTPFAPILRDMASGLESMPAARSVADQASACQRDGFDGVGIEVTDPDAVYVGLVFVGQLVAKAHRAHHAGLICEASMDVFSGLYRGLLLSMLPYVPAEVLR